MKANRAMGALSKIVQAVLVAAAAVALVPALRGQNQTERALTVIEVPLYIAPDASSQKLATVPCATRFPSSIRLSHVVAIP